MEIKEYLAYLQAFQKLWGKGVNTEGKLCSFIEEANRCKNGEINQDEFCIRIDAIVDAKTDEPILKEPALIRREIIAALTESPVRQRIIKTYQEHGHIGSIASEVKADDVYCVASALGISMSDMLQYN